MRLTYRRTPANLPLTLRLQQIGSSLGEPRCRFGYQQAGPGSVERQPTAEEAFSPTVGPSFWTMGSGVLPDLPSASDLWASVQQRGHKVMTDGSWFGTKASESCLKTAEKIRTRKWVEDGHKIQQSMVRYGDFSSICSQLSSICRFLSVNRALSGT